MVNGAPASGSAARSAVAVGPTVRGDRERSSGRPGSDQATRGADGPGVTHVPYRRVGSADESTFRHAIRAVRQLARRSTGPPHVGSPPIFSPASCGLEALGCDSRTARITCLLVLS